MLALLAASGSMIALRSAVGEYHGDGAVFGLSPENLAYAMHGGLLAFVVSLIVAVLVRRLTKRSVAKVVGLSLAAMLLTLVLHWIRAVLGASV